MGIWGRFIRHNAPFLSHLLRHLADEIDAVAPGEPRLGLPILFLLNKEILMGQITVRDDSAPLGATVTFVDAKGAPTSPDDVPAWSSDNEEAAVVAASDDGLSATVTVGLPGAAVISVSSTDTDGTVVTSQGTITVQSGEAAVGDVEFSAPA